MKFRKDLIKKKPVKIDVPRKKYMMCLNESPLNPWDALGDKLSQRIKTIEFNRYFNPVTDELRKLLCQYCNVTDDMILAGNGADEMLYYLFTAVRENSDSYCVAPTPSYFDYKSYSGAVGLKIKTVDLNSQFQFDVNEYINLANQENCKLAILCNPNNPTGNLIDDDKILTILDTLDKPILIDETYFEFSGITYRDYLERYPNLILIRSFSKAFSAAGLRFGYLISSSANIAEIKKVMTVFNLNLITQAIAAEILINKEIFLKHNQQIIEERERICEILKRKKGYKSYSSKTNFLIFSKGEETDKLFDFLSLNEIALRKVGSHPILKNHIRLTIGLKEDNNRFLRILDTYEH